MALFRSTSGSLGHSRLPMRSTWQSKMQIAVGWGIIFVGCICAFSATVVTAFSTFTLNPMGFLVGIGGLTVSSFVIALGDTIERNGRASLEENQTYNKTLLSNHSKNILVEHNKDRSADIEKTTKGNQETKFYKKVAELVTENLKKDPYIHFASFSMQQTVLTARKCKNTIIDLLEGYISKERLRLSDIININNMGEVEAFAYQIGENLKKFEAINNGNILNYEAAKQAIEDAINSRKHTVSPPPPATTYTASVSELYPDLGTGYAKDIQAQYSSSYQRKYSKEESNEGFASRFPTYQSAEERVNTSNLSASRSY